MTWPFGTLKKLHYRVILADPPWHWLPHSASGYEKSAKKHYDLMPFDELARLPVHLLGADDSMLVMWATQAQLLDAMNLMEAWGYTYKTAGGWAKRTTTGKWAFGTGFIFRSTLEFYIVGTIGSPKVAVRNVRNFIDAPKREHSRKPDQMHENLERMFPVGPRCELFGRARRKNWDVWGNQVDRFTEEGAHATLSKAG